MSLKKAPRMASSATEYLSSETGFCIVDSLPYFINIVKHSVTVRVLNSYSITQIRQYKNKKWYVRMSGMKV